MVLQRRHFITFLLVLLITGIALAYNLSAADRGLYPLEKGSDHSLLKCSDRLRGRVESESVKNPISVWIFFADRERERLIFRESPDIISERAVRRRRLRAAADIDEFDYPVSKVYVDIIRSKVVRVRHVSRYLNAVSAEVEVSQIPAISALSFVREIDIVAIYRKTNDFKAESPDPIVPSDDPLTGTYGRSFDQLDQIRSTDLLELGYNASGAVTAGDPLLICVLDTGFRLDHEAFEHLRVVAQYDFIQYDSVTSNEDGDHPEQDKHGTIVLGALAGYDVGELIGPAWGADFLLAKTEILEVEIQAEEDKWIAGLEWADSAGADIVSSSLGYIDWYTRDMLDGDTPRCTRVADIAAGHGVLIVTAMGNEGLHGDTTLIAPADADSVIAVGAVDRDGVRAYFSSRGPTADGRIKPDLMALGRGVYTVEWGTSSGYTYRDGTSLSTPLIAGLCAQLLEIDPGMGPIDIRESLLGTSSHSGEPDNYYGYGIPDGFMAAGLEGPERPVTIVLHGAYPNPFRSSTGFDIFIPDGDPLTVRIYDCRGVLIRSLISNRILPWGGSLTWDGTNDAGRRVAAGFYFMHFKSPSYERTVKVLRVP
jgi:subtilisin family serine protease